MSNAAFVVALLVPIAAAVIALTLGWSLAPCLRVGAIASAAITVALLVADRHPTAGSARPDALALAAVVGTFLVVAVAVEPRDALVPTLAGTVAVIGLVVAPDGVPPAAGALLGALAALAVCAVGSSGWSAVGAAAGLTAVAAAAPMHSGRLGMAVVAVGVAVALVAIATSPALTRAGAVAIPAVLVVGLRALPAIDGVPIESRRGAAVMLAALALVLAGAPRVVRRLPDLGVAAPVGALALAAATAGVPGSVSAAAPLAAAAVLAVVVPPTLRALPAIAGAVVLGDALLDARGRTALVVAVIGGAALVLASVPRRRPTRPEPPQLVGAGVGAWLLLRPSSFAWTGNFRAHSYEVAVADAVAGGLVVVLVHALRRPDALAALWDLPPAARPRAPYRSPTERMVAPIAVVTLFAVSSALLRSGAL